MPKKVNDIFIEDSAVAEPELYVDDEELENSFDPSQADEHQVFLNVLLAYDEAKRKREKYKKFGPIFILVSGIVFLSLIFALESKIDFLILWIITDFYCAALMIRAEYKFYKFKKILGVIPSTDDEFDATEEEAK